MTCSPANDEGDEGFLELNELEDESGCGGGVPSGLDKLINAPVLNSSKSVESSDEATPGKQKCIRRLQNDLDESFEIKNRPAVSYPDKCVIKVLVR